MIAAGLLALATDYNPGSTPSGNMNFVVATACIKMKMTPEEAINAATINGVRNGYFKHSWKYNCW
jgi:imidazolonepropionase